MSLKRLQVGNNGRASLSAGISSTATTINLYENTSAVLEDNLDGIPSGTGIAFILTIEDELILCAARAAGVVTVYDEDTHALGFLSAGQDGRGYGSTSAASHAGDKQAECRNTKQLIDEIMDGIEDAETELALRYTKVEVNALLASKNTKDPVECATTAAITLATDIENGDTIDGITLATGDRVLVKDQASADENGIYIVAASGAPTRSTDMDTSAEFNAALVPVKKGTSNADTLWMQTTDDPVVDTDAISFSDISVVLEKVSEAEAAAGVNDTKYTTIAKIVYFLKNLTSAVATSFINTRTAKTTPVAADAIMLMDSEASNVDKKVTLSNLIKLAVDKVLGVGIASTTKNINFFLGFNASLDFWALTHPSGGGVATPKNFNHIFLSAEQPGVSLLSSQVYVQDAVGTRMAFNTPTKIIVEFDAIWNATALSNGNFGIGLSSTTAPLIDFDDTSADAVTFGIDAAGGLYAHAGSGTAGTESSEITGITLTNFNKFRIEFEPGVDAKFYVNGVLKATITTNLPNGNQISFGAGLNEGASATASMVLSAPQFSIET